jgi:hypothetical protein
MRFFWSMALAFVGVALLIRPQAAWLQVQLEAQLLAPLQAASERALALSPAAWVARSLELLWSFGISSQHKPDDSRDDKSVISTITMNTILPRRIKNERQ